MDKLQARKKELFALGCWVDGDTICRQNGKYIGKEFVLEAISDFHWNLLLEDIKTEYEQYLTTKQDG